jgi:DNA sulfur modification protein DndB
MTGVAREIERQVPFFRGRVNTARRQLGKNDHDLVTITALRGAAVTFAEGITGIKYGTGPVPVSSARLPIITKVAAEWFNAVAKDLGHVMELRETNVAVAPPVLAGIGALGHELVGLANDDTARAAKMAELLRKLDNINWAKGEHWTGILGKFTAKGTFSIGGTKETGYAVYKALSEPSSPEGCKVRMLDAPATSAA